MFHPGDRAWRVRGFAATLLLATLCNGASADTQSAKVAIDNFTFAPAELTVTTGTTVTWSNADDIPHTVVSDDKVFRSKALDTGDQYSFTFTKPGEFDYFCSVHPHMTGKVIVKAP